MDDTTILDLQLKAIENAGFRKVTLLLGHNSDVVIDFLGVKRSFDMLDIETLVDPVPLGTSHSVLRALDTYSQDEHFIILLGDTALAAPLDLYFTRWQTGGLPLAVLCHPNLHMHDSDILYLDERNIIREFTEKGFLPPEGPGFLKLAATGVLFFDRRAVAHGIGSETDITKALIRGNLHQANGEGMVASHYFKDSGTPARISAIKDDFVSGAFYRRGSGSRPALILDRDGTMFNDTGSARKDVTREQVLERIAESLASCNQVGIPVFIVTNQPGIAKGQITFADVHNVHNSIADILQGFGAWIDGLYFCPHHPEGGFQNEVREFKVNCICRKPKDGLLQTLAKEHGINLGASYFIGDSEADEGAARSAGSRFVLASFDGSVGLPSWGAIDAALREMLK